MSGDTTSTTDRTQIVIVCCCSAMLKSSSTISLFSDKCQNKQIVDKAIQKRAPALQDVVTKLVLVAAKSFDVDAHIVEVRIGCIHVRGSRCIGIDFDSPVSSAQSEIVPHVPR